MGPIKNTIAVAAVVLFGLPVLAQSSVADADTRSERAEAARKNSENILQDLQQDSRGRASDHLEDARRDIESAERDINKRSEKLERGQNYQLKGAWDKTSFSFDIPQTRIWFDETRIPTVHFSMRMHTFTSWFKSKVPYWKFGHTTVRVPQFRIDWKPKTVSFHTFKLTNVDNQEKLENAKKRLDRAEENLARQIKHVSTEEAAAYQAQAAAAIKREFATARKDILQERNTAITRIKKAIKTLKAQRDKTLREIRKAKKSGIAHKAQTKFDRAIAAAKNALADLRREFDRHLSDIDRTERKLLQRVLSTEATSR